jgi:carbamoyl-phosphate synthase large subunit
VRILGTSPDSIDRAEDRKRFRALLKKLKLLQADNGIATSFDEARKIARDIGYPVMVRPSYVLGGRAMEIVYDEEDLSAFMKKAVEASPERPILVDKFLEDAIEVDVDAVADGKNCVICGILEHIEQAGIHSGDSAMVLPPYSLSDSIIKRIREQTYALAKELKVKGLLNIQYAVRQGVVYVLEVNPRASRTVPFVSKACGIPWANVATRAMLGHSLKEQGIAKEISIPHVAVKESVFPFVRFPGSDAILSPEMKSTGEVMGIDATFGLAYAKSQLAAGQKLPTKGNVLITVRNEDKIKIIPAARKFANLGFKLFSTSGTANILMQNRLKTEMVAKLHEKRPHIVDMIKSGEINLVINTPQGKLTKKDETVIRSTTVLYDVPLVTTVAGAEATANGIEALIKKKLSVKPLQDYHK